MKVRTRRSRRRIWASGGGALAVLLWLACGASNLPAQSASCAECHSEIAASFAQTGMGRSFHRD